MYERLALKFTFIFLLFMVSGLVVWALKYSHPVGASPVVESHRYKCNVEQLPPNADGFSKTFAVDCAPVILTRDM